jgi:hypothetical protein
VVRTVDLTRETGDFRSKNATHLLLHCRKTSGAFLESIEAIAGERDHTARHTIAHMQHSSHFACFVLRTELSCLLSITQADKSTLSSTLNDNHTRPGPRIFIEKTELSHVGDRLDLSSYQSCLPCPTPSSEKGWTAWGISRGPYGSGVDFEISPQKQTFVDNDAPCKHLSERSKCNQTVEGHGR